MWVPDALLLIQLLANITWNSHERRNLKATVVPPKMFILKLYPLWPDIPTRGKTEDPGWPGPSTFLSPTPHYREAIHSENGSSFPGRPSSTGPTGTEQMPLQLGPNECHPQATLEGTHKHRGGRASLLLPGPLVLRNTIQQRSFTREAAAHSRC